MTGFTGGKTNDKKNWNVNGGHLSVIVVFLCGGRAFAVKRFCAKEMHNVCVDVSLWIIWMMEMCNVCVDVSRCG